MVGGSNPPITDRHMFKSQILVVAICAGPQPLLASSLGAPRHNLASHDHETRSTDTEYSKARQEVLGLGLH